MTGGWLCYFILLSGKPSWRRWCRAETWWCHLNTGALTQLTLAPENRWGTSLQWPHIGSLKSATVGGFAYQKSANAMNQDIFFSDSQSLSIYQHSIACNIQGKHLPGRKNIHKKALDWESPLYVETYQENQHF